MGQLLFLVGTLGGALARATLDQDGRRWAIAHQDGQTYVAWQGPGAVVITHVGVGGRLCGAELEAEPTGLHWEPLAVPQIRQRRAAA